MATNDEFRSLCERHYHSDPIPELLDDAIRLAQKREIIERESDYSYARVMKAALALAIAVWGAEDAWKQQ